mmetsp:Transcript_59462/g.130536  ORF Transcript_59462/g.130536 Transcript_59462/m.130536 type:complete len:104 (-) Transcript_59462:77-388(-)
MGPPRTLCKGSTTTITTMTLGTLSRPTAVQSMLPGVEEQVIQLQVNVGGGSRSKVTTTTTREWGSSNRSGEAEIKWACTMALSTKSQQRKSRSIDHGWRQESR